MKAKFDGAQVLFYFLKVFFRISRDAVQIKYFENIFSGSTY